MKRLGLHAVFLFALLAIAGIASYAIAGDGRQGVGPNRLSGYQENPDISTAAKGTFRARIDRHTETIWFKLRYSGLEGTVEQAHIHFGKRAVNGGVAAFLCSNLTSPPPPPETAACPQSGTVEGTIEREDIIGPVGQGIEAMNFDELVAAIRRGNTYANVHSSKWPLGEIRAQITD